MTTTILLLIGLVLGGGFAADRYAERHHDDHTPCGFYS